MWTIGAEMGGRGDEKTGGDREVERKGGREVERGRECTVRGGMGRE